MATPEQIALTTLSTKGHKYTLNKSQSSDIQPVLALQGVNLILRKMILGTSIGMTVTQASENEINMAQTATSVGIPGTTEKYVLDFHWRDSEDPFFGPIRTRARWVKLADVGSTDVLEKHGEEEEEGGKVDWALNHSQCQEPHLIYAEGISDKGGWNAKHIWGFEMVGGQRKFTRRTRTQGANGEVQRVRMVYDFES